MKFGILITAWLFFFTGHCLAQSPVQIQILTAPGKEVRYQVTNNSKQTSYYYIGLEQCNNNNWGEIILDIDHKAPEKAALVRKLEPAKKKADAYSLKNIPEEYRKKGKLFRFKLTYGTEPDKITSETWSDSFKDTGN